MDRLVEERIGLSIKVYVLEKARLTRSRSGNSKQQGVVYDRTAEPRLCLGRAAVSGAHTDPPFRLIRGLFGSYHNGTANGISSVQRALRALENLDLTDVE